MTVFIFGRPTGELMRTMILWEKSGSGRKMLFTKQFCEITEFAVNSEGFVMKALAERVTAYLEQLSAENTPERTLFDLLGGFTGLA
jgi:hypothetical protein